MVALCCVCGLSLRAQVLPTRPVLADRADSHGELLKEAMSQKSATNVAPLGKSQQVIADCHPDHKSKDLLQYI